MNFPIALITLLLAPLATAAGAVLELPLIFQDHMVLQREIKAPVWGKARPGAKVQVRLLDQVLTATADAEGRWKAEFDGLPTRTDGTTLVISSDGEQVTINDVVVGEVWFCSGQSNAAHPLELGTGGKEEAATHSDPLMRVHIVGVSPAFTPQFNATGKTYAYQRPSQWYLAVDGKSARFGGTPYYFAKELRRQLGDVPVGIVQCAVGGRPIQSHCSRETLSKTELGRRQLAALDQAIVDFDSGAAAKKYAADLAAWKTSGKSEKLKPVKLEDPRISAWSPASLFNGMEFPQIPYGFRGAIWYQGENNMRAAEEPRFYADTLTNLIHDWRARFGHDFTFLIVQLAGFRDPSQSPEPVNPERLQYAWPFLQNQQRIAQQRAGRAGLVVANDIGEVDNIHPGNKLDVGRRLARWAMVMDYGAKLVPSGPLFEKAAFNGDEVTVSFQYANGLKTRDGKPPGHFDLAGADGKPFWADARIEGDKVIVSSKSVPRPVQVRYAWSSQTPTANLVNAEGLPASCFIATESDPEGRGEVLTSK